MKALKKLTTKQRLLLNTLLCEGAAAVLVQFGPFLKFISRLPPLREHSCDCFIQSVMQNFSFGMVKKQVRPFRVAFLRDCIKINLHAFLFLVVVP